MLIAAPPSLKRDLIRRARQEGRPVSELVREALEAHLPALPPPPDAPPADADLHVRLPLEAAGRLARRRRSTLSAIAVEALCAYLGRQYRRDQPPVRVSVRLPSDLEQRLRIADQTLSRDALFRSALEAMRQQT